jgi:fatty acid desaturase
LLGEQTAVHALRYGGFTVYDLRFMIYAAHQRSGIQGLGVQGFRGLAEVFQRQYWYINSIYCYCIIVLLLLSLILSLIIIIIIAIIISLA